MPQERPNITARFLESLSRTLDVAATIAELDITKEEARSIIRGLIPREARQELLRPAPKRPAKEAAYCLNVDGASRGNPGPAGAGAVLKDHEGRVVKKLKKYLGLVTNNVAEYSALLMGLETARALGVHYIRVYADSELMVRQMNGLYRVKSEDLRPLYEKAAALASSFKECRIEHVYRADNSIADSLANEAIDTKDSR